MLNWNVGLTYALTKTPTGNDIGNHCVVKKLLPPDYPFAPFAQGKNITMDFAGPALIAIKALVEEKKPELIIASGAIASWLLLDSGKIDSMRGSVFTETKLGVPVIATYSFFQIIKQWSLRPIAIADFIKAKRFIDGEFHQPIRQLLVEPTLDEIKEWCYDHITSKQVSVLSIDIETKNKTITCIGFAPDELNAMCIPFYDPDQPDKNYWRTVEEEIEAYKICKWLCESDIPKLGQNFLYDIQYLRKYGISPKNCREDTMLRAHSLDPEMPKGLGFLATIHTDEAPWKMVRNRDRDQIKAED